MMRWGWVPGADLGHRCKKASKKWHLALYPLTATFCLLRAQNMTLHCQYLKKKSKTKGMMWSSWMSSIIGGVAARRSLRVGKGGEEHRTWGCRGIQGWMRNVVTMHRGPWCGNGNGQGIHCTGHQCTGQWHTHGMHWM